MQFFMVKIKINKEVKKIMCNDDILPKVLMLIDHIASINLGEKSLLSDAEIYLLQQSFVSNEAINLYQKIQTLELSLRNMISIVNRYCDAISAGIFMVQMHEVLLKVAKKDYFVADLYENYTIKSEIFTDDLVQKLTPEIQIYSISQYIKQVDIVIAALMLFMKKNKLPIKPYVNHCINKKKFIDQVEITSAFNGVVKCEKIIFLPIDQSEVLNIVFEIERLLV